jgi:DNA-binding beta-propeller fold protein YncE
MRSIYFLTWLGFILLSTSCGNDPDPVFDSRDYPEEIGQIMINTCATSGCHNDLSYVAAGGLNLTNWESLFEGSRGGSPVVPYRPDQSFLMFFINTDPSQGITLSPVMPFNGTPLSADEYASMRDWILNGAPNKEGKVKFADNAERRKFYVTNQGCDLVSVFDAATQTLMRYIDVGSSEEIESPHQIKTSPDGKFWYTIFFSGTTIQKFNAVDDSFVSEAQIGVGSWNTFRISSDGKYAFAIDWSASGSIAVIDLENMQLVETYGGSGVFEWPHGSCLNQTDDVLYVTAQHGNFIYKIDIADIANPVIQKIALNDASPTTISWLDPHEIEMTPDGQQYFVTCQESNEVRVMNTANDSLLTIIPTGTFPQELSISHDKPFLFVSCTEDGVTYPGKIGSIHVIDYTNHSLVKTIYSGFQPHGIAVDDMEELVYVSHRNINPGGPAPHHSTSCAGRNGYVTIIDLNTLELVPNYKVEVSVDPYSVALRN